MSRQISEVAAENFMKLKPCKLSNTEVKVDDYGATLALFGNEIAYLTKGKLSITNRGYKTPTTKERLNALPNVKIEQKANNWFLNGNLWKGELVEVK